MSRMLKDMQLSKGLTLIELLVVVAVILVLAAVTWVMVNPLEVAQRTRDASRLIDLADFKQLSAKANMPTLPVDPINNGIYHYTFCADKADKDVWEISAKLESDKENHRMSSDRGNDDGLYEVGTNLTLIAPSGGLCTY